MCSSGMAERSRTAHFTEVARWGNSTTSGPASHSTRVRAPTGEPYVVHSTCMRSPGTRAGRKVPRSPRRVHTTGAHSDAEAPLTLDLRDDIAASAGRPHLHR